MSTLAFSESGITMRTYLSINYLTSAALLAKKAHDLEAGHRVEDWPDQTVLAEHHAFATSAIMMSAAAVEAFVNELFAECRDQGAMNHLGISTEKAALVARIWTDVPKVEREFVLEKYELALRLLDLPGLDRKSAATKAVDALFALRNSLMHYKLVTREAGNEPEEQRLADFEKKLQGYFVGHAKHSGTKPCKGLPGAGYAANSQNEYRSDLEPGSWSAPT
ncbi:hypothetical protein CFB82_40755 [Burkholderia sp. HI2714]|uniref:hypothetical protein n=1 Tax=Burkholderia sp. HI2714 TaxID=2015359 RepID=UPI000B7A892D|nr:hypothetical protein [Burkholderia sp. HI2714]OXJ22467.1 hypothetical protein CFB82_40755 [Burkholderia sp. HI2714]